MQRPAQSRGAPIRRALRAVAMGAAALVVATVAAPAPAATAAEWTVVERESRIGFSGTHAGRGFKGAFARWTADITFDPAKLETARAVVKVDLASAATGDTTYDKTLPTVDWFNIAKFTTATFTTTGFTAAGGNAFEALGTLDLRGTQVPVTLRFTFERTAAGARLEGRTTLKRTDFGIGKGSDATGEWVSIDIPLEVSVALTSKG